MQEKKINMGQVILMPFKLRLLFLRVDGNCIPKLTKRNKLQSFSLRGNISNDYQHDFNVVM